VLNYSSARCRPRGGVRRGVGL